MEWTPILRDFGIFGGLVIFFVWTTWQRASATERFVQQTLVELLVRSTKALESNTQVLEQLSKLVSACPSRKRQQDDMR